jgi:hypothetical protein
MKGSIVGNVTNFMLELSFSLKLVGHGGPVFFQVFWYNDRSFFTEADQIWPKVLVLLFLRYERRVYLRRYIFAYSQQISCPTEKLPVCCS